MLRYGLAKARRGPVVCGANRHGTVQSLTPLHHDPYQADWQAEAESLRTRLTWAECERDRLANQLHRAEMALHQARLVLQVYELRVAELEDDLWRTQLWCARLNDRNGGS